ncbi:MAG: hypothetical protein ACXU8N_18330 [Telluria sp.]
MIAALIVLAWLGVIALVLGLFVGGQADSACNQNCNQGRSCTCAKSIHG